MSVKRYTPKINIIESSEDIKVQLWELHDADGRYVLHSDYAALLASHNALREAVAWLREVDDVREWLAEFPWLRKWSGLDQCVNEARAEVDRLIANEGSADCEGEG